MRLFGTNGIREVVGQRLTPTFAAAVAGAIAHILPPGSRVAVGRDGRTSSPALSRILIGTLGLGGHDVVDLGVLPTPAIQYSIPKVGADLGVIVTASHNPPEFNGFKVIGSDGLEIPRAEEERIEASVAAGEGASTGFDRVGEVREDHEGARRYVEGILAAVDVVAIRGRHFKVVLDCGNGASTVTSPELLRRLGCRVITLNGHLDGRFPGHLSEPTEENLRDLLKAVPQFGADLGIAHDGDADRAVLVDAEGHYVPGEITLTWIAQALVARQHGGLVVTPVSAPQSVEDVVRPLGGEVVYTRVGSPAVVREMLARKAVFGGEENGGLIFPEFQLARDGGMTAATVLELLARGERSLKESVAHLPRYVLLKRKLPCPAELRAALMNRLEAQYREAGDPVDLTDGLKVTRPGGWVLIRPSGTEPLVRIFAQAKAAGRAEELAEEATNRVEAARTSPG